MKQLTPGKAENMPRFLSKVQKTETCWLWIGYVSENGYGTFYARKSWMHDSRNVPAHRWAYEAFVGPIPDGLHLDHLCRVRHCVNPDHLEPVTPRENALRGIGPTATNHAKTHCIRGHEFTEENTFQASNGGRACRACRREVVRRNNAKRRRKVTDGKN